MNPAPLSDEQLLRYSRHILLDEFGIEAQDKLRSAHALIVGAGGLGTPAALYLAAAGIGRITLADPDVVDLTNLQRQILYRARDIGNPKAASAMKALTELNPEVTVVALERRLGGTELDALVSQAQVVLECSDNFATRHAVNRACVAHAVPLVSGAAIRFDGQISVFDLRDSDAPCYHCLFPETGEAEEVNCATLGIFAPLTGVIGALQAGEAIKCVTQIGRTLSGRLLLIDGLTTQWQTVALTRDAHCPVCAHRA